MLAHVRRGLVAGAAGGAAMALVLVLVGERAIAAAIAIEERGGHGGDAVVSRGAQQVGGAAGALLAGAAMGAVLAVVFAATRRHLPGRDDFERSVSLAGVAYLTLFLAPFVKYPANPPAVGDPATIGRRTGVYLAMVGWSLVSAWGAWRLGRWLRTLGHQRAVAAPAVLASWVVLIGLALALLPPSPDRVTLPATLVWRFRLASAGGQLAFWAVAGTVFGWLGLAASGVDLPARDPGPAGLGRRP